MDSYGRMGLTSHQTVIGDRQASLRHEAAQARIVRASTPHDDAAQVHERQGFLNRLFSVFTEHGHRARRVTRDVLQVPAPGTTTLRTIEHRGR